MEEFLRYTIGALVEQPASVVVSKTESTDRVVFHVTIRKSDAPRVIGRNGHTIRAIRTLLAAAGRKRNLSTSLELIEI
jgi:predicted RNA-binding protein YlqC (UPF0109 family)